MKKYPHTLKGLALAGLLASFQLAAAEYILLPVDSFTPLFMHGKASAAKGWMMRDQPREAAFTGGSPKYVSGDDCFKLEFADGAMTIRFPNPMNPIYDKRLRSIRFEANTVRPLPPAPKYRFTGKTKFDRGVLVIGEKLRLQPSADWKDFEYTGDAVSELFALLPEPGTAFSFKDFRLTAVYPENTRNAIKLPDGGELTRIVLQTDDSGLIRRQLLLWRGWLWKLTGTALPVDEVAQVDGAVPGALAVRIGKVPPGGWHLKVDRDGIFLTVGNPLDIAPALFDYLHRYCNYRYFWTDRVVDVKCDPDRPLPGCDFTAKPKFHTLSCGAYNGFMSGGLYRHSNMMSSTVDYCHLPVATPDHILNVLMPKEMYFKTHPEYFMLNAKGERQADINPYWLQPCFSNPEAVALCVKNFVEYAKQQPYRRQMLFYTGDNPWFCSCPKCREINGKDGGCATTVLRFMNKAASAFAKAGLKQQVYFPLYEGTLRMPKENPDPRLHGELSIGHDVLPCTLHVDCALNRRGYDLCRKLSRRFGGRERMEIQTYRDARPRHFLRQMEYVNRFACEGLLIYAWHGYDPAIQYVTARWNLGTPAREAIDEYNRGVYGKGAKVFTEIEDIIDEFCRNYKHTKEEFDNLKAGRVQHIAVRCGTVKTRSVLDRRTFDRLYAAFDRALAEVGDGDPVARRHLLRQKASYLLEDLNVNRRFNARSNAELAAFAERLALLCRIAREVPDLQDNVWIYLSGRTFVSTVAGLAIPDTGKKWCFEPFVDEFLKNPSAAIPPAQLEKIAGGWSFKTAVLNGGLGITLYDYNCAPRLANFVRRPKLGNSRITAVLTADKAVAHPLWLVLTGLDDDKPGASSLRVAVNGKVCFEGKVPFGEREWSSFGVAVPDGLAAGKNEITIDNVTSETPSRNPRPGDGTADLQWGWVAVSDLALLDPNGEFDELLAGRTDTRWRQLNEPDFQPLGKAVGQNGKLTLTGSSARYTGMIFCRDHAVRKPAGLPGKTLLFEVTASGSGTLEVGFWAYNRKNVHLPNGDRFKGFKLGNAPRRYTVKLPLASATVLPMIRVAGRGSAVITDFKVAPLQ